MHEHCTELVTNLLLPSWFDLQSTVNTKFKANNTHTAKNRSSFSSSCSSSSSPSSNNTTSTIQPLNSIDIIDGDDYYDAESEEELVNRLKSSMREPHVEQLVLSEIVFDPPVVQALIDLLKIKTDQYWEAVYIEFCRGQIDLTVAKYPKVEQYIET